MRTTLIKIIRTDGSFSFCHSASVIWSPPAAYCEIASMDQFSSTRLSLAPVGEFICTDIDVDDQSHTRMKSLGICTGRELELVSSGDPMIVRVGNSRIGLSRALAASVSVCQSDAPTRVKAK